MNYLAIIEKGEKNYGAYCPDLPGLGVVGDSEEEAMKLLREALVLHIESLREHGDPVPEPVSRAMDMAI